MEKSKQFSPFSLSKKLTKYFFKKHCDNAKATLEMGTNKK